MNAYKQHLDDALQVAQSFVNGGVRIKAGAGKLVLQDSIQALCEALSLLLQPALLLLKLLIVPAMTVLVSNALHFLSVSQGFVQCMMTALRHTEHNLAVCKYILPTCR